MIRIKRNALKLFAFFLLCLANVDSEISDREIRDLCWWKLTTLPHPNPKLCNKFVQCQIFNGVVITCAPGKVFIESEGCVAGNYATCGSSAATSIPWLPSLTPPPQQPPTVDLNKFCAARGVTAIFPNPNNCHTLVICREGIFLGVFECPSDTPVVDPNTVQCVQGNPDTCEIGQPTTTTTSTTTMPTTITLTPPTTPSTPPTTIPTTLPTTTAPPPPDAPTTPPVTTTTSTVPPPRDICRGNNLRFVADPNVCYRFFYCLMGVPLPGECEKDRIFDSVFGQAGCVRGNRVTCTRDSFITVTIVTPTRSSDE